VIEKVVDETYATVNEEELRGLPETQTVEKPANDKETARFFVCSAVSSRRRPQFFRTLMALHAEPALISSAKNPRRFFSFAVLSTVCVSGRPAPALLH